jgi:hypothetical protein
MLLKRYICFIIKAKYHPKAATLGGQSAKERKDVPCFGLLQNIEQISGKYIYFPNYLANLFFLSPLLRLMAIVLL